jgi:cytoskeletal protein RodZ
MRPLMSSPQRADGDFGARMRQAREAQGVSLRQIAETTKLSVRALEALERNDISLLPGGIFSRAFVRAYASEIGIDPEQTVREFIAQFPHDSVTIGSPHVPPNLDTDGGGRRRLFGIVAMVLVIAVLAAAGALYVLSQR